LLVLSRPDAIESIHASFLEVGCDVIETDTFGGTHIVLGDYDLSDKVYEINLKAAQLARAVVNDFSTPAHPCYVAGSMGPGTRLPPLGHISYPEIYAAYQEQARGLIHGGVDVLAVFPLTFATSRIVCLYRTSNSSLVSLFTFTSNVSLQI
jgi:5-methyltetrahydrofolate--homocysteine methyltransferase